MGVSQTSKNKTKIYLGFWYIHAHKWDTGNVKNEIIGIWLPDWPDGPNSPQNYLLLCTKKYYPGTIKLHVLFYTHLSGAWKNFKYGEFFVWNITLYVILGLNPDLVRFLVGYAKKRQFFNFLFLLKTFKIVTKQIILNGLRFYWFDLIWNNFSLK